MSACNACDKVNEGIPDCQSEDALATKTPLKGDAVSNGTALQPTKGSLVVDDYLSPRQAAEKLGCSKDTILRRIHSGKLPAVRDGRLIRVRAADVAALLKPTTPAS